MRILIIGGTGFIGRFVTQTLAGQGHEVAVFHRGRTTASLPGSVHQIAGDRASLPGFQPAFRKFAPEAVVDTILSSERQARLLTDTFRGWVPRIIALSSMDVYRVAGVLHGRESAAVDNSPLNEESPLRTVLHPYPPEALAKVRQAFAWVDEDYDKIPVERLVLNDPAIAGTVLRLPMTYGPGDPLHRLHPIIKRVDDGRRSILIEENAARWRGPRGYVENVAAAVALATVSPRAAGRVYNVAEAESMTEMEWTRRVARAAGFSGQVITVPTDRALAHLKFPGNTAQHWVADSTRIRQELGYTEAIPLDEALIRTIAWQRENPPAAIDPNQFDYAAEDAAFPASAA